MTTFKRFFAVAALVALAAVSADAQKLAITAHRGNWNCEEGGGARNSIAALKAAQDNGYWGSEFDVQMTKDFKLIVHHDAAVKGVSIWNNDWSTFSKARLENGEPIPTLDEYLTQGEKSSCVLVCELKSQKTTAHELYMTDLVVNSFKGHNLLDPKRVIFISFSLDICKRLALLCPGFTVQYLGGDIAPDVLKTYGINGIDYKYKVLYEHPEWVQQAHDLGMSVNVWTVNKAKDMRNFIDMGVDVITTNEPLLLREILGEKEYKN